MSIPIIGLTTYNEKNKYDHPISVLMHQYIDALTEAGGVPVLIPSGLSEDSCQSLLKRLDGIIFTGGGDISVDCCDGEINPRVKGADAERDALEFKLLNIAVKAGKPFLGICRGIQLINVGLGGTLYIDIEDQFPGALKHDYDSGSQRKLLAHEVYLEGDSLLANIVGDHQLKVNSLHHQGIKDLAPLLQATAHAADGLVEAVELPDHPFGMAVQWHPEWLTDQPVTRRFFQRFIEATGKA
jgi:putative glutamine amidotransferase